MTDKLTKENRSKNMAQIKSKNTQLEINFRKQLYKTGVRYVLNYPLFGRPDLAIPSKKIAIFINGCFWHHHKNCRLAYMPKSNTEFWKNKLTKNAEHDKQVRNRLKKDGWKVITVWECEIKNNLKKTVTKIIKETK